MARWMLPVLLAAAAAWSLGAADAAQARNVCNPAGAKVLAESAKLRVLKSDGRFYGCHEKAQRLTELWLRKGVKRVRKIEFAGNYVGYASYAEGRRCDNWRVGARSMNLRTGRKARRLPSVGCYDVYRWRITDLALRGNGSFAVIRDEEDLEDGDETETTDVIKVDGRKPKTLDTEGKGSYYGDSDEAWDEEGNFVPGPNGEEEFDWIDNPEMIVLDSLRYAAGQVYWSLANGEERSAPLG